MAVIGIDFDGTIVPRISDGYSNYDTGAERVIKKIIQSGNSVILFTCRNNSKQNPYNLEPDGQVRGETSLQEALRWFSDRGISVCGVNRAPGQLKEIGPSSKPLVDILIDDTGLGIKLKEITIDYIRYSDKMPILYYKTYCVDWDWVEEELQKLRII